MQDIAIFGAGGFGREVGHLILSLNEMEPQWNLIGFFDDAKEKGSSVSALGKVLGGVEELNNYPKELSVVIAIGSPKSIMGVYDKISNKRINFPNIIAPDFKIVDKGSLKMGKGNIIQSRCVASCDVTIGNFNVMNGSVVLGHNVEIGDFNVIMPAARISGEVKIKQQNLVGVGAIILQRIHVGRHVAVGPGSVLYTKPKDGGVYIGNPAKLFKY